MAYTYKKRVNTDTKHSINYPNNNPFEKNSKTGGNCTWWAWGRFKEVYKDATGKNLSWTAGAGDACTWYRIMGNAGYKTGKTPKPGAIVCWGYYGKSEGGDGHVAFVEEVFSNGDFEISQSGYSSGPIANKRITKSSGYKFGYNNDYFNGFIYNKVEFTNPDGTTVSGSSGKSRQWYINKYGNGAEVYFILRDAKYTHKACCAVLGNMEQESGIRTKTGGSFDGNGSEGLCQWTFGRKTAMQKYAKEHSKSGKWDSVDGQVAYLIYELEHSEKKANLVLHDQKQTLNTMTIEWGRAFERPSEQYANWTARCNYAKKWNTRMKDAGDASDTGEEEEQQTTPGIDMQKRSSKLYSSANYEYLDFEESEEKKKEKEQFNNQISNFAQQLNAAKVDLSSGAVPENIALTGVNLSQTRVSRSKVRSTLSISDALVEVPFIEADFNGYIIGSKSGSLDTAPNYISQIDIIKTNGEINQYKLQIVYQIRPGEDPNKLDQLFSQVKYNKIKLRYGDAASNSLFKDTEAIITNITQNRDYAGMRITYTVSATSACNYVTSTTFDFPATTDKPSNVIRDLLYKNGQTSQLLAEAFPGMSNQTVVASNNWIPTNDAVVNIPAQVEISTTDYISYLTGIMSNQSNDPNAIIRNSTYYLTYQDDANKGSYFKISEVSKVNKTTVPTANIYNIDINFPDDNQVYAFSVNTDNAWSLLYEYSDKPQEYIYNIDNIGEIEKIYSPNYFSSSQQMNELQKNWWTQMVEYPISAQLTLKGLLKPISLMDYININVRFYGVNHITSGLYVVTNHQDILSGAGFRSNLGLVRVSDITNTSVVFTREQKVNYRHPTYENTELQFADVPKQSDTSYTLDGSLLNTKYLIEKAQSIISKPKSTSNTNSSSSENIESDYSENKDLAQYQFAKIGNKLKITVKGAISYSSSNTKIAKVDKNGTITAVGSGSTTITVKTSNDTQKITIIVPQEVSRSTVIKPVHTLAKELQEWMWNAKYKWIAPTKANSKAQGTCITYPSVIAQELGLIKSGEHIAGSGGGGTNYESYMNSSIKRMKAINANYWTWHKWPKKKVKELIKSGKIVEGDIITIPTHVFMYAGKKDGNITYHEAGHAGSGRRDNGAGANRPAIWHKNNSNSNGNCIFYAHINDFTISTSCKNGTITATRPWLAGQTVKIKYSPKKGYKLKSIKVDGSSVSISKHPDSYTFKNIDKKHSVKVEFE